MCKQTALNGTLPRRTGSSVLYRTPDTKAMTRGFRYLVKFAQAGTVGQTGKGTFRAGKYVIFTRSLALKAAVKRMAWHGVLQ